MCRHKCPDTEAQQDIETLSDEHSHLLVWADSSTKSPVCEIQVCGGESFPPARKSCAIWLK